MDNVEQEEKKLLKNNIESEIEFVRAPSDAARKIYRSFTIRDNKQSTQNVQVQIDPSTAQQKILDDSLPRFGPIYQQESEAWKQAKKKAWQRVKYVKVGGVANSTKEKILSAIRRVEKEARETYSENFSGTSSEFRMMMIKDGCLFIQMAFMILGRSHTELGYLSGDKVFNDKAFKEVRGWMEAMFYVGNQIPLVVLKELVKQKFFQDLIDQGNWNLPTLDLRKRVLYEQLVLPRLDNTKPSDHWVRSLVNLIRSEVRVDDINPCDVVHALHNLVLGPHSTDSSLNYTFGEYKGRVDHVDLEANNKKAYDYEDFSSTMDMKQAGIYITKLKSGGPRSIRFKSFYFCARLYLPVFPMDEDLVSVFQILKRYEINNKGLGNSNLEVCSYISLMSNIIQTPQDLILLQKNGIVEHSDHAENLPGIIGLFYSKDVKLTYNLRNVKRQITNFSSPLVRYQHILNLVFFLTLVQAVFAVLAYFKPPS